VSFYDRSNQGNLLISHPKNTVSFIVRVWIEPREIKDVPQIWRGVVEVMKDPGFIDGSLLPFTSQSRIAFHTRGELLSFLDGQMKDLGIPLE
jgi:hypothetical protein